MPVIHDSYIDKKGNEFVNVRNISFTKNSIKSNLGEFVAETEKEDNVWFNNEEDGVYIYQSYNNPNIAYRIYKRFAEYRFNGEKDEFLISELKKRQESIKLSKFPTGVVTLEGNIIGQEIPYFPNSVNLIELFKHYENIDVIKIYLQVLNILKEMYDNGILYFDNHAKNFMVNPNDESYVNIIDFEDRYVRFDNFSKSEIEKLFTNYSSMINILNRIKGLDLKLGNFVKTDNFLDTYEEVKDMEKKLVK